MSIDSLKPTPSKPPGSDQPAKEPAGQLDLDIPLDSEPLKPLERPRQRVRFRVCWLGTFSLALSFINRLVFNLLINEINDDPDGLNNANNPSSSDDVQWLLSAFYITYCPTMVFVGLVADRYGSKPLMLANVAGSGLVSLLTPLVARYSYAGLLALRMLLGLCQASMAPALYALYNCWLTRTEANMFTSVLRVINGIAFLVGFQLPNLVKLGGFGWTLNFYLAGGAALVWSLAWLLIGESRPESSSLVSNAELAWIERKKTTTSKAAKDKLQSGSKASPIAMAELGEAGKPAAAAAVVPSKKKSLCERYVMLEILAHPSFWVLAVLKFCYNIGGDFIHLELPTYSKRVLHFEQGQVSLLPVFGVTFTLVSIPTITWLAQKVVQQRKFGWSRTCWRKVFQGSGNLMTGLIYLSLANWPPSSLPYLAFMVTLIYIFWSLGAGGEALAAFDMSTRYPSTIFGLAHSVATLTGFALPALAVIVVDRDDDQDSWSRLFAITGWILIGGGVLFVSFFKAKPFLASEIAELEQEQAKCARS